VARIIRFIGRDVDIGGFLAGWNGQFVQQQFESAGLRGHYVWCNGETRKNVIFTESDGAQHASTSREYTSARTLESVSAHLTEVGNQFDWVSLSGDIPRGTPPESYVSLLDAARPAKLAVLVVANLLLWQHKQTGFAEHYPSRSWHFARMVG